MRVTLAITALLLSVASGTLATTPAFAQEGELELELQQPESKLLAPNTAMECRMDGMDNYGFLLERGNGKAVRITVINDNKNEGDKSAMDAELVESNFGRVYVKHFVRWKDIGSYQEFVITPHKALDFEEYFPAKYMTTSSFFSKDTNGVEQEELVPENLVKMGCKPVTK